MRQQLGTATTNLTDVATKNYVDSRDALNTVSRVITAAATVALADAGQTIESTATAAITLTIPTNATVAFPLGSIFSVTQMSASKVTIAAASGVTIRYTGTATGTRTTYSTVQFRQSSANVWVASGDVG